MDGVLNELNHDRKNLHALLDLIIEHVPPPSVKSEKPFAMLATLLDSDPYLGRCLIGKVEQGSAKVNDSVKAINLNGDIVENGRLTKLLRFNGAERVPVNQVSAGDIICIAGLTKTSVADTICESSVSIPIKSTPIDPPTMSITILVNDSPFAGLRWKKSYIYSY